jgi:hypothetical protein
MFSRLLLSVRQTIPAVNHFDLLTVLEHELGHLLGIDELDIPDDLMSRDLMPPHKAAALRGGSSVGRARCPRAAPDVAPGAPRAGTGLGTTRRIGRPADTGSAFSILTRAPSRRRRGAKRRRRSARDHPAHRRAAIWRLPPPRAAERPGHPGRITATSVAGHHGRPNRIANVAFSLPRPSNRPALVPPGEVEVTDPVEFFGVNVSLSGLDPVPPDGRIPDNDVEVGARDRPNWWVSSP